MVKSIRSKNTLHIICIISLVLLGICTALADKALAKKQKETNSKTRGWLLKQSHVLQGNDIDVLLTAKAFKWHSNDSDITILMKAPDWKVRVFREKAGKIYTTTPDKFSLLKSRLDYIYGGVNWSKISMKKIRSATVSGIKLNQYKMTNANGNDVFATDYWVCTDIKMPAPVTQTVRKIYNAPNFEGYPTKQMYKRTRTSAKKVGFHTRVATKVLISKNAFKLPKGLKAVKSLNDLYENKTHEQGLDLLIRN